MFLFLNLEVEELVIYIEIYIFQLVVVVIDLQFVMFDYVGYLLFKEDVDVFFRYMELMLIFVFVINYMILINVFMLLVYFVYQIFNGFLFVLNVGSMFYVMVFFDGQFYFNFMIYLYFFLFCFFG